MSIKAYEFKKVITSPIIIALLLMFIGFNAFVMYNNSYFNKELKVLNNIVCKLGYEINDKMLEDFSRYYNEKLNLMKEITSGKGMKSYDTAAEFFKAEVKRELYSKKENEFFKEVGLIESYYNIAKNIDEDYNKINIRNASEGQIEMYRLKGEAAATVRRQYEKLSLRFDELKEKGEHKNLFFIGRAYRMHTMLFKTLFRKLLFEIMILTVLVTAFLLNYEFENKTYFLTYSTRRGRRLNLDKFYIALFVSVLATTVILGISLGIYFLIYDYSGLWKVPISSGFNWEYNFPYISWWNVSFAGYLFIAIAIIYLCEMLFAGITYIISYFIRNSYYVFCTFGVIFGLALILPGIVPTYSRLIFVSRFTPFMLSMNPHFWLMEKGALALFKNYELITIGSWGLLLLVSCSICTKSFKKQNLY